MKTFEVRRDNVYYYEEFDWAKANLAVNLQEKVQMILELIPSDVKSVLDVGCGDGTISNILSERYTVIAVDRSPNALQFVKAPRLLASAHQMGIKEQAFDLVFSSEMLEHLPDPIFDKAISEIQRVSRKYIIFTFPNEENIDKGLVECPECRYRFNKIYHLRSLNQKYIADLLPEFLVVKSFAFSSKIRRYNPFLLKIKHNLSPSDSWIPPNWTRNGNRKTACPNCGNSFEIPYKFNIIARICDLMNILFSPKKPYQLFVLLKKK